MKLLISGGGTGGHIYPAITIAKGFLQQVPGAEVLYVGTKAGLESAIAPREGIPFRTIDVAGLFGKSPREILTGAYRASRGFGQALGVIRSFRPAVVCGTGGYVCGPVVAAAWLMRVPSLIQEQNAIPGMTNKLLSRFSRTIALQFPGASTHFPGRARAVVTGNPVRPEILRANREEGASALGLRPDRNTLLAFGGSRGAAVLNRAVCELVPVFASDPSKQLIFATGQRYFGEIQSTLDRAVVDWKDRENILVQPYLHRIEQAYALADLAITRAGGMTIAELTALGIPSVIIPSPNVTHNHQYYNARALAEEGGCLLLPEEELGSGRLRDVTLDLLENHGARQAMAERARQFGHPDATRRIVELLASLAG